jgi:hypothetical protein
MGGLARPLGAHAAAGGAWWAGPALHGTLAVLAGPTTEPTEALRVKPFGQGCHMPGFKPMVCQDCRVASPVLPYMCTA